MFNSTLILAMHYLLLVNIVLLLFPFPSSPFPTYSLLEDSVEFKYWRLERTAQWLTSRAVKQQTILNSDVNVCQTWLLAWAQELDNPEAIKINLDSSIYSRLIYRKSWISSNTSSNQNTSFFNKEITTDQILHSLTVGPLKFTTNCISVFIDASSTTTQAKLLQLTNELLLKRICRPHNDYFVFIGIGKDPDSLISTIRCTKEFEDFRFKYVVVTNENGNHQLTNICALEHQILPLFSRKCPSLINGHHFEVTSVASPLLRYKTRSDGTKVASGLYHVVSLEISLKYNFTFNGAFAEYNGASGFKKDGEWKGVVGEVFSRKKDFSICTGINVDRHFAVEPSVTLSSIRRVFYVRKPSVVVSWKTIFWPFSREVWNAFIATCVGALLCYYGLTKLSQTIMVPTMSTSSQGACPVPKDRAFLYYVGFSLLKIMLEQSAHMNRWKGFSLKMLIILWIIFSYILGTGYRGNLVSFLSTMEKEPYPKTHEEVSLSDYKLLFRYYGGIAYLSTKRSPLAMHQRIIAKSTLVNNSIDCLIPTILHKGVACLDFDLSAQFAIAANGTLNYNRDSVFVTSVDSDIYVTIVWAFRKYSPLTESFDWILLSMHAAGLVDYWANEDKINTKIAGSQWLKSQPPSWPIVKTIASLQQVVIGPTPMSLTSLFAIFTMLIIGLGSSTAMFLVELLWKWV